MDELPVRYTTTLEDRIHEYGEVYTFIFKKVEGLQFESGNYVHVLMPTVELPDRPVREISFASAPQDDELVFTITTESRSPWQVKLLELKNGDQIKLFKIKGHLETPKSGAVVMIANGIGITPFRSIIREHFQNNSEITPILIHIGRTDYLYKDEFSQLQFEQHRITREEIDTIIDSVISENKNATFMIAGTPAFVETMAKSLLQKNVWSSNIQTDAFKGLND